MDVISPAEESSATVVVTENRDLTRSATEESPDSGVEAKAECELPDDRLAGSDKNDEKNCPAEGIAISNAFSQMNNADTSSREATEAIDGRPQKKELENVEITLVVEMNTDAETAQNSGTKEEGDAASPIQAPKKVGREDSDMGDPDTTSEAAEGNQQHKLVDLTTSIPVTSHDCSVSCKMHEIVGKEQDKTDFQEEVATEEDPSLAVTDDSKSFKGEYEEGHSIPLVPARDTSSGSLIEENLAERASGSMHRSTINEEEMSKQGVGGLAEMKMETDSGIRSCKKRAAEEQVEEGGLHSNELSEDVMEGDKKKGRLAAEVSVQLTEPGRVQVLEPQPDPLICTKGNGETNFLQGSECELKEEMTGQASEQGSGSMMVQTELRATEIVIEEGSSIMAAQIELIEDQTDLDSEGVQKGSGDAISTVEVGDKDASKEWGKSHIGMDMIIASDDYVETVVGEGTQGGRQEQLCRKEPGGSGIDRGSMQSYQEMESGAALGAKQELMEGKKSSEGNDGAAELDDMDVPACNTEVLPSKESRQTAKVEQEDQKKEAASELFGQETQFSPVFPSSLHFSRSDGGETSHTNVLQQERKQCQEVDPEKKVMLGETHHGTLDRVSAGRVSREALLVASNDKEPGSSVEQRWHAGISMTVNSKMNTPVEDKMEERKETFAKHVLKECKTWSFQGARYDSVEQFSGRSVFEEEKTGLSDETNTGTSEEEKFCGGQLERERSTANAVQKRKLSDNLICDSGAMNEPCQNDSVVKKAKKKTVNVWAKTTSRKGPKKNSKSGVPQNPPPEDSALLTPVFVNPDKVEDGPDQPIALSKYDKAEKIELSDDRLTASSTKGYRMVRATRGVEEGTWYYEIVVEQLGPTGHTRLGWSTQKGDVQAPVGFDGNSYGYRDLDGSKTHVAIREPYGDLYVEGDVIGFYIHLPNGAEYAPNPAQLLSYRGRPYLSDVKEEQPRRVPGSEICFFRNGVSQGTAFKDIYGGRYFPAASMYTLPKEPSCTVRFNFGPDFRYPPMDLDGRPVPKAMVYAPYHNALSGKEVGAVAYANVSATGLGTQNIEPQMNMV